MMTESKFATPAEVLAYMFAGNATFTFRSLRTDTRFTYNIRKGEKSQPGGVRFTKAAPDVFFVKVLTGPDNTSDFTYIGMIIDGQFKSTAKSKMRRGALPVDAFIWALGQFHKNTMPEQMEVWHTGRCGRCGRVLTVPESVATGIGPDCAAQMGIDQIQLPVNAVEAVRLEIGRMAVNPSTQTYSADVTLDRLVEEKVTEFRSNNPEAFFQDGMLDLDEALAVARNKFRKELEQDDRYLGSKFGELEAQQETEAYRRMQ